jgi:hypothetical protein
MSSKRFACPAIMIPVVLALACNLSPGPAVSQESALPGSTAEGSQALNTPLRTGFSCLLGYWEVEPDSLKDAANSIITTTSIYILSVGPSVLYAFYPVSEPSPTPFRMDVWYTDVLVTANIQHSGAETPQELDMHVDGVLAADVFSDTPGEIIYTPIEGESSFQVTDIWLDGVPLSESPIDLSDLINSSNSGSMNFQCLSASRISLQTPEAGRPIYLNATSRRTRISP